MTHPDQRQCRSTPSALFFMLGRMYVTCKAARPPSKGDKFETSRRICTSPHRCCSKYLDAVRQEEQQVSQYFFVERLRTKEGAEWFSHSGGGFLPFQCGARVYFHVQIEGLFTGISSARMTLCFSDPDAKLTDSVQSMGGKKRTFILWVFAFLPVRLPNSLVVAL